VLLFVGRHEARAAKGVATVLPGGVMGIRAAAVVAAVWVVGLDNFLAACHALPDGFFDEAIVTRGQHRSILPVSMSGLPDESGRYLVADKHGKIWIGADPAVSSGTLELYMHMPDTFSLDEVSRAHIISECQRDLCF
jgi:hypothetical protein